MVGGKDVVRLLNSSAFHDSNLVCSGELSYLGGYWSKTIGSAVSSLHAHSYNSCANIPFLFLLFQKIILAQIEC